ncbi:hypothetical protein EDB81DRAFT_670861 [Dactylonectria macrodidyma]|uniref:Uncharacterized protein n=1 Tax=Dactylonectria macrodidyma TaxID=307937 RepID=A0A9P9D4T1_9HYPO|nr:hypothetical protein EDB81DRAFT_670861 [Dactylonectria macrodidyma]
MDPSLDPTGDRLFGVRGVSLAVTAADSLKFFKEHGLFYQEDAAIGGIVDALDQQGLTNRTDSFQFFTGCILGDARIRPLLEPYLSHPNPQVCHTASSDPGHIFAFSIVPTQGDRVVVHMWCAGSRVEFYENSHNRPLKGVLASNGLLEIPEASLKKNGCKTIGVEMEKGGIAILNERSAFQIRNGFTIAYGLGKTPDQGPVRNG